MSSRATENTVTTLLKEELEKFGVRAQPFRIINTPVGRREADILCYDAGIYIIEAKFSEDKLITAIAKIQNDYLRFYDTLNIKGGFALLYPKELKKPMPIEAMKSLVYKLKFKAVLMFPPKDSRNFSVKEGTLQEIAKILAEQILTPPEYIEPSVDYMIKSLKESAYYIVNGLRHLAGEQLEGIFGGKNVFKNILQYEEEKKYPVEDLRLAAAYLLINQLLFYHVLSRTMPDEFPEIDPDMIRRSNDLNHYFNHVLDINYKTVFSYNVASWIPPNYVNQIKMLINVVKGISPEKVSRDLLGTIFHDLVPFEIRKSVAAFYTNILAAELLAHLAIDRWDVKVADFACGSGGLLVAAYRRKRELLERMRPFTQKDHKRFIEEDILGIDVMPFAANVAACHLALQSPEYFTNKVQIAIWDSTDLKPGKKIPSVARLETVLTGPVRLDMYIENKKKDFKGVVMLGNEKPEEIELKTQDIIIMNPPFTRQERMTKEYKELLIQRLEEYKDYIHPKMGYYGYFILLADRFLKDQGKLSLVLPSVILRVKACKGIRELLSRKYHIEYIIATWQRSAFSESVRFREILLIAKKSETSLNSKVKIILLKKLPRNLDDAKKLAEEIKKLETNFENENYIAKMITQKDLRENINNWFRFIATRDENLLPLEKELLKSNKLVQLSSIAKLDRCFLKRLRYEDFTAFILHDKTRAMKKMDVWLVKETKSKYIIAEHKDLRLRVKVPKNSLVRGLRRMSYVNKLDITNIADYIIIKWFDNIKDLARILIRESEIKKLSSDTLKIWANEYNKRKTNMIVARRFDISAKGTRCLAFYSDEKVIGAGLWSVDGVEGDQAKILTLWINSTINILQWLVERVESRGAWLSMEDYVLSEMLVPDPKSIPEKDKRNLLEVFNSVREIEFPSILEQLKNKFWARVLIDKTWLQVLGYKGDTDTLLNKLYNSLANEIEILKKLMKEKLVYD